MVQNWGKAIFFHVVFLVILQISTCKNFATKHTIPQNTEIFGFLGSKYQIITRLVHQNENRPYDTVPAELYKWGSEEVIFKMWFFNLFGI